MNSAKPRPGDLVVLTDVPPGLINDLPLEDQCAISEVVGKPVRLNKYDDPGRVELEFIDSAGIIHFIYVNPNYIRPAK